LFVSFAALGRGLELAGIGLDLGLGTAALVLDLGLVTAGSDYNTAIRLATRLPHLYNLRHYEYQQCH